MTEEKYTGSFEEQMDDLQEVIEKEMKDTVELDTEPVVQIMEETEAVEVEPVTEEAKEALKDVQEETEKVADAVDANDVLNIPDKVEFTDAEKAIIAKYAADLDLTDTNSVLQYGADAQEKIAEFSDSALQNIKTSDLGAIGESLSGLVT
jgi:uncharacterized protein YaaN involved in tellurite resistance